MIKQLRTFSGIILALIIFSLAGWLLYAPTLQAPFVYDDIAHIVNNPHIRLTGITPHEIAEVLKIPLARRPLANITFAFNYYLGRYDVWGYHIVNLSIHIVASLLVFFIAGQTLGLCGEKNARVPFLAAALWLVNPIHTQSVAYIVQRMNSLAAMFVLLALTCYILARRTQIGGKTGIKPVFLLAGTGLFGLCGLASKEIAAILPVIIFLYEWFFYQNLDRGWLRKNGRRIGMAAILFITSVLVYMEGSPVETLLGLYEKQGFTMGQRLLTEIQVVLYYLTLLIFPHPSRLNLEYNFPLAVSPVNPIMTLPAILALLALVAVTAYTARKHRLFSFAILWFLIALSIESSFIGLALIFEHRTYLPFVFPAIAVAYLLDRRVGPPFAAVLVIGVVIVCGYWTWQRNHVWADPLLFWQDNVRKSPDKAVPNNNLGLIYKNMGALDQAMFFSKKALALRIAQFGENHPEVADSLSNIGLIYYRQGNYDRALACHADALARLKFVYGDGDRQFSEIYNNIGLAYDGKGDVDMAVNYYRQALDIDQSVKEKESLLAASIYNNLGSAWHKKGAWDKAITNYKKGLALRTELLGRQHQKVAECYNNLGLAYGGKGDYEAAIGYFQQALHVELSVLGVNHPYTAATYFNLGLTCYTQKDYDRTVFYMRKVLTLYADTLGRHHPYIETARSILAQASLKDRKPPSGTEGVEDSRCQGVKGSKP